MTMTWLITGASSGLGLTMASSLLSRGARVVAAVRRPEAMDGLKATFGQRLLIQRMDVEDAEAIGPAMDAAFAAAGRIERIVSNAGYGLFGAAEELTEDQIERQIAVNLLGSIRLIRASLPHLRAQGGGRILQVSSEGGQIAYPNFSLYHASKWGIEGFIEAVRQEVEPFGIAFTIVQTGPTATGFAQSLDMAPAMNAYDRTPSGAMRRMIAEGQFAIRGDAQRTVEAMIAAGDAAAPPFRLTLGSQAYDNVEQALTERLLALRSQGDVARSADADSAVVIDGA